MGIVVCPERGRLTKVYRVAVDTFRNSVHLLSVEPDSAFHEAFVESERRRIECEKARIALEEHRDEHKC
jgi:hypothetical protein